jgi:ElaB/YqjD/DUF883 family membrane-anchored ribosome-binding protein
MSNCEETQMALSSRSRDELSEDLQAQIANLSNNITSLQRRLSGRAAEMSDDAAQSGSALYDLLARGGSSAGRNLSRQASRAADTARHHPATAATAAGIGLLVIGLLISLLLARK